MIDHPDFSVQALSRILFRDFGLAENAEIVLAYSGGRDSQVLLDGLVEVRKTADIRITAAHFDHGLNDRSGQWADQCAAWCASYNVEYVACRKVIENAPGASFEATARTARYRWLDSISEPGQVVVTAHHANDQAETFLLGLFQGKDFAQLAGISPDRPLLYHSETRLIRPLLPFPQAQLQRYAEQNRLPWIDDPSNHDTRYYRNYIRQEVLPLVVQQWPEAVTEMGRGAHCIRKVVHQGRKRSDALLDQYRCPAGRTVFCLADPLNLPEPGNLYPFELADLLRAWIHHAGLSLPSQIQFDSICNGILHKRFRRSVLYRGQAVIQQFGDRLFLRRDVRPGNLESLKWQGKAVEIRQLGIAIDMRRAAGEGLDPDRLRGRSGYWMWRRGGEKIRLPNRKHRSSMKKLFQTRGVPPWERDCLPYLVVDDEIAWVHGIGATHHFISRNEHPGISPVFTRLED